MSDKKTSGREIDQQIKKAYVRALSGADGEILRKDLEFFANKTSHVPGDPYTSAYNEGKREMARNFLLLGEANE